jgi:hypothetical protein
MNKTAFYAATASASGSLRAVFRNPQGLHNRYPIHKGDAAESLAATVREPIGGN